MPNESRLNELEFYFPLKSLTPEAMKKILRRGSLDPDVPERIDRLDFAPLRGFMKGFMDMVFRFEDRYYLVDWKSNFLGARVEDYGPENLGRAMEENFYTLQYHLYTIGAPSVLEAQGPGIRLMRVTLEAFSMCSCVEWTRRKDLNSGSIGTEFPLISLTS